MTRNICDDIRCKTCKWFRPFSEPGYEEHGICMYNPPVADLNTFGRGRPCTNMNDYCSRYEKRNEQKENADA